MSDQGLPLIIYEKGKSFKHWAIQHGESYQSGIKELIKIRKDLMLQKNPALREVLSSLATEQVSVSRDYNIELFQELEGISEGANVSLEDLVILNNYTDFRDIQLPEEGCSTVAFHGEGSHISGQTWDMHKSAKDYISLIQTPLPNGGEAIVFSLVGCLGMMGINTDYCFVGVNNINTQNARAALIWPMLVRKLLYHSDLASIEKTLLDAPVTSGHNYLIGDQKSAAHWEVTPTQAKKVSDDLNGAAFHTNHCLHPNIIKEETPLAQSSTSQDRFKILKAQVGGLSNMDDLYSLLTSHEGYPKSICGHYESGAQDPSTTCGGGVFDHNSGQTKLWRGCPIEDTNYKEYSFTIKGSSFQLGQGPDS